MSKEPNRGSSYCEVYIFCFDTYKSIPYYKVTMTNLRASGFTIVELLIVIVVLGVLAALITASYSGAQTKAKISSTTNTMRTLQRAIIAARVNSGKSLQEITGSFWTAGPCVSGTTIVPSGQLNKTTHVCWTTYKQAINDIATAASTNLDDIKNGDAWGNAILIDENEGEAPTPCTKDTLKDYGADGVSSVGDDTSFSVPFYSGSC
jgi:prepilin-type N-terminal cleavage/methylation domain-containing protein